MFRKSTRNAVFAILMVLIMIVPASYILIVSSDQGAGENAPHMSVLHKALNTGSTYSVTFSETGLPSGKGWAVQFGSFYKASDLSSISFNATNSSYLYFAYVQGESPYILTGIVKVSGANIAENLVFNTIIFQESGMAAGAQWGVGIGNTSGFSSTLMTTNSTLQFIVAGGTYSYTVYTTSDNLLITTTSGKVAVSGNNPVVALAFDSLKFSATGYPFEWGISLANTSTYYNSIFGTSSSFTTYVLPGNYSYRADVILNHGFSYFFAEGYINTSTSAHSVSFSLQNVTFIEKGLPSGAYWGIAISNTSILPSQINTGETTATEFSLYLDSGKYTYTRNVYTSNYVLTYSNATPVPMDIVTGTNSVSVSYKGVYAATFQETGINLTNASWGVYILIGTSYSLIFAGTPELTLYLANGTYTYYLKTYWENSIDGNYIDSDFGSPARTLTVRGSPVIDQLHFYEVNYSETGQPIGSSWYVYLYINTTWVAYSYSPYPSVPFFLPAANYTVSVILDMASWQSPFTGVVKNSTSPYLNISKGGYNRTVNFYLKPGYYAVTIDATGMPSANDWVGELFNTTTYSESDLYSPFGGYSYYSLGSATFIAQNGSYTYQVYNNYYGFPMVASGSFPISGNNVTIAVNFGFQYNATEVFTETGLPAGTAWGVTIAGVTHSTSTSDIYFTLPLGSYSFEISSVTGYTVYPGSGILHLTNYGYYGMTVSFIRQSTLTPYVSNTIDLNSYRAYTGDYYQSDQIYGQSSMVYDRASNLVYVADSVALYVINASDMSTFSITAGLSGPSGVALDPYSNTLYVSDYLGGNIALVNASTANIIGYISTGSGSNPSNMLFDSYNHYLYVYQAGFNILSVINTLTDNVVGNISLPADEVSVFTLSYDSLNGNVLLTDSDTSNISVISGITILKNISVPSWYSITGSTFVPSNGYLYLTGTANLVMAVNLSSGLVVANITIPNGGTSLAFDPASGYLVVANFSYNGNPSSVFLISVSGKTYIGSVPVGYDPESVAIAGKGNEIYVMNMGSDTVSIISSHISQYSVTFSETGLPQGQAWEVGFGGVYESSTASSMTFNASNGTYDYTVISTGYSASPSSGTATVDGSGLAIAITFAKSSSKVSLYDVTFEESGLPNGTRWVVTLNGATENSTRSNITFSGANGTYRYNITQVAGFTTITSNGTLNVSGSPVTVMVYFKEIATPAQSGSDSVILIAVAAAGSAAIVALALFITKRKGIW